MYDRKKLKRAIVERGKYPAYKSGRQRVNRRNRRAAKIVCASNFDSEEELDDIFDIKVACPSVNRWMQETSLHDTPLFRWLDAQNGRSWAKVYNQLCSMFSRRSSARARMLYWFAFWHIDFQKPDYFGRYDYWVDENDVFHAGARARHEFPQQIKRKLTNSQIFDRCAKGRKVIRRDNRVFWAEFVNPWENEEQNFFKPGRELTRFQYKIWNKMSQNEQEHRDFELWLAQRQENRRMMRAYREKRRQERAS